MKILLLSTMLFLLSQVIQFPQKMGEEYRLNINNINLPLNRNGVIANVNIPPDGSGGIFGGKVFLFSSGFFLSGYSDELLWANAVASASLVQDYLPGTVNTPNDTNAVIYVVKANDEPFGQSWQDWVDAVALGADFYDGDGDGIYNPIDKNSNGLWDPDEDAPDFLGDATVWCVYNDGVPATQRRWNLVNPLGIEIKQTLFAYESPSALRNIIFIRYRIKYVGLGGNEPDKLDSVHFGLWADADIGEPHDDVVGCDTTLNAGYTFNNGPDYEYGINPPSFFTNFLSGPPEFIPGITFIDVNENGMYDEGTDEPLDTAYIMKGQLLGIDAIPGARNQPLSSFVFYVGGDPDLRPPDNHIEARNYTLGKTRTGLVPDPCTFPYGEVIGMNCAEVNPAFWVSGDPVEGLGWLCTVSLDLRQMTNSGSFTLNKNEEKEIIAAYVVGQGDNALSSISEARNISNTADGLVESNFDPTVVSVEENHTSIPEKYFLFQNFPNPFNPSTIIRYQVSEAGFISLKVYDILGREVAILVNEEKPAGNYEVDFNASRLTSGVYFYRIQTGEFIHTRKMLLIK